MSESTYLSYKNTGHCRLVILVPSYHVCLPQVLVTPLDTTKLCVLQTDGQCLERAKGVQSEGGRDVPCRKTKI